MRGEMDAHEEGGREMSKLVAYEYLHAPAGFAAAFVKRYLEGMTGEDARIHLRLRVPTAELGVPGGVALEKEVIACVGWAETNGARDALTIAWEPNPGEAFPTFSGTLEAHPDVDEGSKLALIGEYRPPGSVAGSLFDGLVGFWIARATAHDLLRRLRDAAEGDYAARGDLP